MLKRPNERKDNMDNRCMRLNMNKTKVMEGQHEEWQKVMQKAGVCGRGIGNNLIVY